MKRKLIFVALLAMSIAAFSQSTKTPTQVRITRENLPATVDLTNSGVIYELDFTEGVMDVDLITVRSLIGTFTRDGPALVGTFTKGVASVVGTFTLQEWMKAQWPQLAEAQWTAGQLRVGWTKDFHILNQTRLSGGSRRTIPDECTTKSCFCSNKEMCIRMLRERGPCTGSYTACQEIDGKMKCACGR